MGPTQIASRPEDWRLAVRAQFHRDTDVIKLGSRFSLEEIRAAVEEAHGLGPKATVDAETFHIARAVEAGANTIEFPLPRSDETIQLMANKRVAADPRLVAYQIILTSAAATLARRRVGSRLPTKPTRRCSKKLRRAGWEQV